MYSGRCLFHVYIYFAKAGKLHIQTMNLSKQFFQENLGKVGGSPERNQGAE